MVIARSNRGAAIEVCELIRKNYFRAAEPEVRSFLSKCSSEAESEPATLSKKVEIARINRRLSGLKTSHLSVYTPVENKQLWTNERLDTGIRARRIDGEIVVYRLIEESPAVKAGLKPGDAIVMINGEAADEDEAVSAPGIYKIARGHKLFDVEIMTEDISEDLGPRLIPLEAGIGHLRIGSFLPQYFDGDRWPKIVARLKSFGSLVIDVRGNAGGSFPAALRALSPFVCGERAVGSLWTSAPKTDDGDGGGDSVQRVLPNDLEASPQLDALNGSGRLELRTFSDYRCYEGPVVVLVDEGTSSVAEIFAEGFFERSNSRIWGVPTAGQVVMARWFEIGSLGGGDYAMAIPIAGYRTAKGKDLERQGVDPQKILIYDLEQALRGQDSWLNQAIHAVSK